MKAYTGIITKAEFVKEIEAHEAADNFIRGTYWDGGIGKGCAVGCSLESIARLKNLICDFGDHSKYPEWLCIPEWLGRVEDTIFERLPLYRSKKWPLEFAKAVDEGADLEKVKAPFLIFILKRTLTNFNNEKFPDVTKSINDVIALWEKGGTKKEFEVAAAAAASAASAAAYSAADVAYSTAAYAAAYSAADAASAAAKAAAYSAADAASAAAYAAAYSAADVAYSTAAYAAAYSAAYAAYSAADAAYSAADASASADAASAAAYAAAYDAADAAYEYFADKLLEMIREVKSE